MRYSLPPPRATFVRWLLSGLGLLAALSVASDAAPAAAPAVIPLAELRSGMSGYGLTVFSGSRVDTFGVTVVGVQHNTRVSGDLLIVELSGHGLEVSSIAQGMSGSPVYFGGRFAGALAFGWQGALRPLAGVTPAAEMLAMPVAAVRPAGARATPIGPDALAAPTADPGLGRDIFGAGREDSRERSPALTTLEGWPDPQALFIDLMSRGATMDAATPGRWLYRPLGLSVTAAGAESTTAPSSGTPALRPGAACAVPLVTGDASLGAIGTVTWVDGNRVLMMGHPIMQRGPVDLPLATADILTVFPSRDLSFKLGSVGDIVGTVHHDLRAGLAGRLGPAPDLVPVGVDLVTPQGNRRYDFEVVDDTQLTPVLVFWSLYNALLAEGDDGSRQTIRYELTTHWDGPPTLAERPLVLTGMAAGPGGVAGLAGEWMAPLMLLLNNPHAATRLCEVQARLEVQPIESTATIVGLAGPRRWRHGDGEAVFEIAVQPRQGPVETVRIPVMIPPRLAAGPYRVVAASAADLFALEAQRVAGSLQPQDLTALVDILRRDRTANELVLAFFSPGEGVVVAGRELSDLPPSAARVLRGGNRLAERTLADYALRRSRTTPWVLAGHAVRNLDLAAGAKPVLEEKRP